MKNIKIMLYKSNQKRDGSYPVCLRVSKDGKRKYISLGLSALGDNGMKMLTVLKRIGVYIPIMRGIICF